MSFLFHVALGKNYEVTIAMLFKINKLLSWIEIKFLFTLLRNDSLSPSPYFTRFQRTFLCQAPEREDSSMKLTLVVMGNLKEIPKRYWKLISISLCGPDSNSFYLIHSFPHLYISSGCLLTCSNSTPRY